MPLAELDRIQITWSGIACGQTIQMVRMYQLIGGGGVAGNSVVEDLNDITDAIKPGGILPLSDVFLACLPNNYQLLTIRAQRITPVRSVFWEEAITGASGTVVSPCTVANTAGVIVMRTDLAGRDQVSLAHVGPLPTNATDQGLLTNDYRPILQVLADALVTPLGVTDFIGLLYPIIYHRSSGTSDILRDSVNRQNSRVMRRRTVGYGI